MVIVAAGIFAPVAGWLAMQRARSAFAWFVLGALTGPIAIGLLLLAPPGRCPACDAVIDGWPSRCPDCRMAIAPIGTNTTRPRPKPTRAERVTAMTVGPSAASALTTVVPSGPAGSGAVVMAERPTPGRRAVPIEHEAEEVLATGIYLSGNAGMEIGALYGVARVEDRIRVFGPMDAGQLTVRLDRPLAATEVTVVDDKIIISSHSGRRTTSIVLRWVGGRRSIDLETALALPTDPVRS